MKMLRIAICDDNSRDLSHITSLVESYKKNKKTDIVYMSFHNAIDLLESLKKKECDLLLLDVLMPGFNGLQAAHELRKQNDKIEIIFLTSSPEYAVESYNVRAHHYLLKPATEDKLFPLLDKLIEKLKKPEEAIIVKSSSSVFTIPYKNIEYVEINAKTIYFYLTDNDVKKVSGSMAEYEALLLKRSGFIKVHRSYLVNLHWVQQLNQKELITLTGRKVPIARTVYTQIRTAYTQFLFKEADELTNNKGGISRD
ncbi:MAG: response regulator transcription factor [Clostridiaceae bacterium]|jgi:DNA-binding LytR/AlgR family response regulator|nr:response regulator transcription factor [Clostridiaceae bacterium]